MRFMYVHSPFFLSVANTPCWLPLAAAFLIRPADNLPFSVTGYDAGGFKQISPLYWPSVHFDANLIGLDKC
jgi:hypothetical protein